MYLIVWLPYKYHNYNLHEQMYMAFLILSTFYSIVPKTYIQINRITKYFYNKLWIYMFLVLFNTPTRDHEKS